MTSTETNPEVSRVDMHCHSSASAEAGLAVQSALGLPECATAPETVYELAKARGMDFVTITDHDTIDGVLQIADRPDVFISEELTAWFRGEPQAVHILCYDITPDDHHALQERAVDLELVAEYLQEREITAALAHPFFAVAAPLDARHRRRLAELFHVWEVRNGSRERELNRPALVYAETRGAVGIGGSDDHAGVEIGRTWSETPPAVTPREFLDHILAGQVTARGNQGSAAKWAHSAIALATRVLGDTTDAPSSPRPDQVLSLAMRVVSDGANRGGTDTGDLGPEDAKALLAAWTGAMGIGDPLEEFLADDFDHARLFNRARRLHEKRLDQAIGDLAAAVTAGEGYLEAGTEVFDACLPVVPYAPAMSILAREKARLSPPADADRVRVAVVVDGVGSTHGVSHVVERLREAGVPGHEVEVLGTDPRVDRRLPSVADIEIPFYAGAHVGVPSLLDVVGALAEGQYDLVHITSPGPAGIMATLAARIAGLPLTASHHTDLTSYAALRSGSAEVEAGMQMLMAAIYNQCELVLSPSAASDRSLANLGVDPEAIVRWGRGVDVATFSPDLRDPVLLACDDEPDRVNVLYAGRLSREKGVELLADAFLAARRRDSRLHLVLAGGGPEEDWLRHRLEAAATEFDDHRPLATFLGWLDRAELARVYASSDIFLFCSQTDTYGQVIAEAQASGLPVVAVGEGGPTSLIQDGRTGWLCHADAEDIAGGVAQLAASDFLRQRLSARALEVVSRRTWEESFDQLAIGWKLAALAAARRAGSPLPDAPAEDARWGVAI